MITAVVRKHAIKMCLDILSPGKKSQLDFFYLCFSIFFNPYCDFSRKFVGIHNVCELCVYLQRHTQKLRNLEFQHVVKPESTEEVEAVSRLTAPSPAHQRVVSSTPGPAHGVTQLDRWVYLPFLCRELALEIQTVFNMETRLRVSKDFFNENKHLFSFWVINMSE